MGVRCVGATIDTAANPEVEMFIACLAEGFDEVVALAHAPETPARAADGAVTSRR